MKRWALRLGRYGFLTALTIAAAGVMWWVSRPNTDASPLGAAAGVAPPPVAAQPRMGVFVTTVEPSLCDITVKYSGKIEPWETYSLGFEIGGRVMRLGERAGGAELDDGDRVTRGQLLAQLDERILRARLSEAVSNFEFAASELQRSERARERSISAVSEAEYQNDLTSTTLARAAQQIAQKSLEDATLFSPVDGVITERMVEAGESVNPHTTIFEIVENDRLRLVLNVPEARVRELDLRRRAVAAARRGGATGEDAVFRARVRLEGLDIYGRPWPPIDAEVYRISEVADSATGLFEVEVLIPNEDATLRPGMVATALLVTDRVLAYQAPESAVIFRQGETYLYSTDPMPEPLQVMFWEQGQTTTHRARRVSIDTWIDQGETVVIPADALTLENVVVRGQRRLRNGQLVRVLNKAVSGSPDAPEPLDVAGVGSGQLN
ncbi:MAG: efflux RND transporter periplasmic adaptor subunit [Planctomycetota bacterium]